MIKGTDRAEAPNESCGTVRHWRGTDLEQLALEHGTPTLVYSSDRIASNVRWMRSALSETGRDGVVCVALKAVGHATLAAAAKSAGAMCEVMSAEEYAVAMTAGFDASDIVVNGLGWTPELLDRIASRPPFLVNVDNEDDGRRLDAAARRHGTVVQIGLRVVPRGHQDFVRSGDKLGTPVGPRTKALAKELAGLPGLDLIGLSVHALHRCSRPEELTSLLQEVTTQVCALERSGHKITIVDLGGGLDDRAILERNGITCADVGRALTVGGVGLPAHTRLALEPGRFVFGDAAVMITRVVTRKPGRGLDWLIVDAGTNVLLPLEAAHYEVAPVTHRAGTSGRFAVADGICSPTSVIAADCKLPADLGHGDLLAVSFAGSYTLALAENWGYGSPTVLVIKPDRTCRVLVDRVSARAAYLASAGAGIQREGES